MTRGHQMRNSGTQISRSRGSETGLISVHSVQKEAGDLGFYVFLFSPNELATPGLTLLLTSLVFMAVLKLCLGAVYTLHCTFH